MAFNDIRDYLFNKLFFPKVVVIDKPGIIYNTVANKLSGKETKKRIVWYFEDVIVNLQLETIKKLDPNMIHSFVDSISGQKTEYDIDADPESEGGLVEKALGFAKNNPELAQKFLDGLNKGQGEQQVEDIIR